MSLLLANGWICTMDDAGAEHPAGWVLVRDGLVEAVGDGEPPAAEERIDLAGAVVAPGLVNTHHHLYQTLTRARAQEATLFEWLRELYPAWSRRTRTAWSCTAAGRSSTWSSSAGSPGTSGARTASTSRPGTSRPSAGPASASRTARRRT